MKLSQASKMRKCHCILNPASNHLYLAIYFSPIARIHRYSTAIFVTICQTRQLEWHFNRKESLQLESPFEMLASAPLIGMFL
jgi:hypothetical protein